MKSPFRNVASLLFCHSAVLGAPGTTLHQQALNTDDGSFLSKNVSAFDPMDTGHFIGNLKCGVTVQVHAASHKYEQCPEECPYYAQDIHDSLHCSFLCVRAEQCRDMNPNRPIADTMKGHKTCRGPMVPDCSEMSLDGTDTCLKCQMFYKVGVEGNCIFQYWIPIIIVIFLGVCGGFFVCAWIADMAFRPTVNETGLQQGLDFRSRQKLHTAKGDDGRRNLYSEDTNLCKEDAAGPGMCLHFNFQAICALWAFIVAITWLCFCVFVDNDLFIMGMRKFGTPRENCILVAWGFETQQRLMWTKVTFLIITYTFTFVGSLLHSWRQMRIFDLMDSKTKSMKDFAACVTGLELKGDKYWEADLAKAVADATGKEVMGASIAWNFKSVEDEVNQALEEDLQSREVKYKTGVAKLTTAQENMDATVEHREGLSAFRRKLFELEINALGGGDPPEVSSNMKEWLSQLMSSDEAFIVFNTENDRNEAVEKVAEGGIAFNGTTLTMAVVESEPDTINWVSFGNSTLAAKFGRLLQGIGLIFLALLFWTVVFYTPYAYQVFTFNYDNGAEPPFTVAMTFCMVVVLGNAIMYEVCGRVSDYIGFKTRDTREGCYLILYVFACCFNVALDATTTYFMAREILEGLNFRTYYGVKLSDVPTFTQQFETYAMQRILAENTKAYCFPATFLIPFIIEPFITVYFPLKVGMWMVRTHPEWVGRDAEMWMVAFPFDMGRYGDLLLNMLLGILIFYFPGGYTLILFFGMGFSHVYIYLFDHLKVLKTIPACVYATMEVDWYAQWMLAPITATILSCLCFKANCQMYGYCITGMALIEACTACWFAHFLLHWFLLQKVVPMFRKTDHDDPNEHMTWKDMSSAKPCSWFNANPVHCLRSKFVALHKPPATFFYLGKENLMEVNAKIHCYFEDDHFESEDYTQSGLDYGKMTSSFTASMSGR